MGGTYDVILVPGGGVLANGELPLWTRCRLNRAIEQRQDAYIITLSAGTTHKPPPLDADGYPIFESVAAAKYLMQQDVEPAKILVETSSYDTIGNVYFSRMIHVEPLKLRRILVITSEFHMVRTKSIFEWVYRLEGLPQDHQLTFETVSDESIDPTVLEARQRKEAKSLQTLLKTASKIHSLKDFHQWLFNKHGAYAMATKPVRISGQALESY
ncbi:MAG: YdcF family protein [Cyanobacteria bacterium P01_C01_bin.118]